MTAGVESKEITDCHLANTHAMSLAAVHRGQSIKLTTRHGLPVIGPANKIGNRIGFRIIHLNDLHAVSD